ncbi:agamous-like MADS-box protein AGL103 [Ziziphus jujuba]|uniref:Agamous-like MADS-box protein AGL103 n=1 Tax=Ziziphus jujuba TaxID=326968 RepID=A0A6P3ZSA1_ZIZJJ|nr:agamous-like MADS-box protein AGL103 [Ziziphus jujuba]
MGFPKNKFANRKSTLKKKAAELAALCGAEVCVICLDANGYMETWPEDVNKVKATILKYNHTVQATKKKAKTKVKAAADEKNSFNPCSNGIMWDGNLENLSKESFMSLSNCLEAKIQTLDYQIDQADDDDNQLTCVGPIYGFDEIDMNNPDLMTNNCCNNMVMVDQFDQLQHSIPLATDLPPLPTEFSDNNSTTMAASHSLSNCNHIIDDVVGNTVGIIDYDDGYQYWNNLLGADLETTNSDLGSEFNFLMQEYSKEISCSNFPAEDNFCLPMNQICGM